MDEMDKQKILEALKRVQDPDLGRDIVSLGFVKDVRVCSGAAALTLELTTPPCPAKDRMKGEAEQAVLSLPGIREVNIKMTAQVRSSPTQGRSAFLPEVKNTVAAGSGKGGVGKSTVSANLAVALAQSGAQVGLMDADIYGPSIPTLTGILDKPVFNSKKQIFPVSQHGVKIISMGFFLPEDKAVVWRGPMLDKMITQFIGGVDWGAVGLSDHRSASGHRRRTVESLPKGGADRCRGCLDSTRRGPECGAKDDPDVHAAQLSHSGCRGEHERLRL